MALHLRPLRADELPAYIEHGRGAYERDLVAQAGLTPAAARQKTENDWSRLFPDGAVPPGNEVYAIEEAETGERVGDLWFAERDDDVCEKTLYVSSVEIAPETAGAAWAGRQCGCSTRRRAGAVCHGRT